jgi:hypothetical protein
MSFGKIYSITWPVIGLMQKGNTHETGKVMRSKAFRRLGG